MLLKSNTPVATESDHDANRGLTDQRWRTLSRIAGLIFDGGPLTSGYNTVGKTLLALDLADRLDLAVVNVMQNFCINEDGAYWKGSGMIALVNKSGMYSTSLLFEEVGSPDDANFKVRAYASSKDGKTVYGPWVDKNMAALAEWSSKFDLAAPQIALTYRAANFFVRINCPEVTQGIVGDVESTYSGSRSPSTAIAPTPANDAAIVALVGATLDGLTQPITPQPLKVGAALLPTPAIDVVSTTDTGKPVSPPAEKRATARKLVVPANTPSQPAPSTAPPAGALPTATAVVHQVDLLTSSAPVATPKLEVAPTVAQTPSTLAPQKSAATVTSSPAVSDALDELAFDKVIGDVIDPTKIADCFAALARVTPAAKADCDALLAIRLGTMFFSFSVVSPEIAGYFGKVYELALKPDQKAMSGAAQSDLAIAYRESATRLWPKA